MKIAFLVLNHRPPAQLVRLVNTLRRQMPDSPIVVHHDAARMEISDALLEPVGNVNLLTSRKPMAWGDFSIVDVCWQSLSWMLDNTDFDWVILLSAQDYPIKPLSGLADYLARDKADALFHATPITHVSGSAARRDQRRRYFYQYSPAAVSPQNSLVPNGLRRAIRLRSGLAVDLMNYLQPFFKIYRLPDGMPYRFGWRARSVPFDKGNPCYHGSMWFGLSRSAAEFAADYMRDHPEYLNYYRRTIIPDESMLSTLILNHSDLRVIDSDVHYTRWSRPETGHPDTFRLGDLAELTAAPQYFARKFDLNIDHQILDSLDKLVGESVVGA